MPKKRSVPFRSYKSEHLKFHGPANKQILKGRIVSPSQLTVTMVDGGKGQEIQRWPKIKYCPGPLLSAKKWKWASFWDLAYLLDLMVSQTKHVQNGTHHISLKPVSSKVCISMRHHHHAGRSNTRVLTHSQTCLPHHKVAFWCPLFFIPIATLYYAFVHFSLTWFHHVLPFLFQS